MTDLHTLQIPVMGIGYTVDTPIKVAQYGIDSVISLVDDNLLEKLRKYYSKKYDIVYSEIAEKVNDFRAKRITNYLNAMKKIADEKFQALKSSVNEKNGEFKKYIDMLPDYSSIKKEFNEFVTEKFNIEDLKQWAHKKLKMGSIDVNIMSKIDKVNYKDGEALPSECNDAHTALKGFAESDLESAIVLSAGMNPSLYNYLEKFEDFFPDENGNLRKRVILKVSDFRSANIQGKYLAKKGIWVSEYRVESGLNCGGHAFATDGYLMGPILAEFAKKRESLNATLNKLYSKALEKREKIVPQNEMKFRISAQGGVGTPQEHDFLLEHYGVDSVGWGSPFLLVPEAVNVDEKTLKQLENAGEQDLYLSNISPLNVLFNNLKNNTKDLEKEEFAKNGTPGAKCIQQFLVSNTEFTERPICTASRAYQTLKIKELDKQNLSKDEYDLEYKKIVEKACICVGLGVTSLTVNNIDNTREGDGISICPGPNLAYYSKRKSLKDMVDFIYGRKDNTVDENRPNFFIKELNIYVKYINDKFNEIKTELTDKDKKYFNTFIKNMNLGIEYYQNLFAEYFIDIKNFALSELETVESNMQDLKIKIV